MLRQHAMDIDTCLRRRGAIGALLLVTLCSGCYAGVGPTVAWSSKHGALLGWQGGAGTAVGGVFGHWIRLSDGKAGGYGFADVQVPSGDRNYGMGRLQIGGAAGPVADGVIFGVGGGAGRLVEGWDCQTHDEGAAFIDVMLMLRVGADGVMVELVQRVGGIAMPCLDLGFDGGFGAPDFGPLIEI